ncbi:hypothetical protein evm_007700 [Chilo suppressalis]|nr:hypothetical protein evm_007700 [Chilo suppressalis]
MIIKKKHIPLWIFLVQIFVNGIAYTNFTHSNYLEQNSGDNALLSRRKRYLLFPDGSSFQLVFCVQTSALITIGNIFLYGNTAALAWSLPTDPKIFYMLKGYDKEALRRGDYMNSVYYMDNDGRLISKVPYKRKTFVNPAFSKRSIAEDETFKEKLKAKINRMKMHEKHKTREYLKKDHMEGHVKDFHRNSRVDLFGKVEKLLTALGQDGRQCVLYKLCEAAQAPPQQGTFLQEFLRVVFTLPKGTSFVNNAHQEYDEAHTTTNDCAKQYPGCDS